MNHDKDFGAHGKSKGKPLFSFKLGNDIRFFFLVGGLENRKQQLMREVSSSCVW